LIKLPYFKEQFTKAPSSTNDYEDFFKYKINVFCRKVTLTPSQLIENLELGYPKNVVKDLNISPSKLAEKFIVNGSRLRTILDVLVKSCTFLAHELQCNPYIKKNFKLQYMKKVTISTAPQRKGERELDVFSQSY
jgi:hypothetical protein